MTGVHDTVGLPLTASFHANLLAPPLSQDRVTPNTSKLPYPLTASDNPESTSLLKHQTCRVLGNCRALQCPDAIRLRRTDQSIEQGTPNPAPSCDGCYVDSNLRHARVTRSLRYGTQRSPSEHALVSRN